MSDTADVGIEFQLEAFSRWMREAVERGLFEAHWKEVGEDRDRIALDLDFQKLLTLERVGVLAAFSARESSGGELVGYAMVMVSPHLIYRNDIFAFCQEIYLHPEHRGHGAELVRVIERELRGRGAAKLLFSSKESTRAEELFGALGYAPSERSWGKLL